jgi:hypothetical protein
MSKKLQNLRGFKWVTMKIMSKKENSFIYLGDEFRLIIRKHEHSV